MRLQRVLFILVALTFPRVIHAQDCFPFEDFDPQATSTMVDGSTLGPVQFFSPEHADSNLVWWIGNAASLDGCIGGIAPGSDAPTGQLVIFIPNDLLCMRVDVSATVSYTADTYDASGVLVSSVTTLDPVFELPTNPATWHRHRVVLTPGDLGGGGRDALCVDNLGIAFPGLPVRPASWGRLKITYR
jgi:hypothetical protein